MASIREALESAVSDVEARQSTVAEPIEEVRQVAPAETEVPIGETETQKADRLRDEKGRFVEGKAEIVADKTAKAVAPAPEVLAPQVQPLARPSSWKKDYEPHWAKLERPLQEYINQREGEYAKGVSTYKQEWDNAKPLIDAVAPFLPDLQRHGIQPSQWISQLGTAHQRLSLGSGQEKLQMFAKLAQDYGVPLQALYDANFAQQYVAQSIHQQQQRPAQQPVDVEKLVDQKLNEIRTQDSIKQFIEAKDGSGHPLYPHFEAVRTQMGQLLDAGIAQDLKDAYTKALRMNDELFQAEQEAKRKADDTARQEATRKATAAAKAAAVSVKSATPATPGANAKKGLRATLEEAYDQHASGRV